MILLLGASLGILFFGHTRWVLAQRANHARRRPANHARGNFPPATER